MWKEALLKNSSGAENYPTPTAELEHIATPRVDHHEERVTPDHELLAPSVGTTPGSIVPNDEVPSVEYFANLRTAKVHDGTNSVTSTEFTFHSNQNNSTTGRSESWADDDDDFLNSFGKEGYNKNAQPAANKGGWKAVTSRPSQVRGGKSDNRGQGRGQDHNRKGRGNNDVPQASSGPLPASKGRFDPLGAGQGSWRR